MKWKCSECGGLFNKDDHDGQIQHGVDEHGGWDMPTWKAVADYEIVDGIQG